MQIRLVVPYSAKDRAKSLGARWDVLGRFWYVPHGVDVNAFREWWPDSLQNDVLAMNERYRKQVKAATKGRKRSKVSGTKEPVITGIKPPPDATNNLPWE